MGFILRIIGEVLLTCDDGGKRFLVLITLNEVLALKKKNLEFGLSGV